MNRVEKAFDLLTGVEQVKQILRNAGVDPDEADAWCMAQSIWDMRKMSNEFGSRPVPPEYMGAMLTTAHMAGLATGIILGTNRENERQVVLP